MLQQGYVELLGIVDPAQFTNNLDTFLADREGLVGFAFATADAENAARQLAAAGLKPGGPKDLGRLLELPEGDVTPRFKLVMLPRDATPGVSAFLCQHLTPELLRRPEWLRHANGATALVGMTAVVDDPRSIADAYERLCGPGSTTMTDDTLTVRTGRSYLVFARPDDLAALHPDVELPEAPVPFLAAMTFAVDDPGVTRAYLQQQGLDPAFDRAGSVRLDASAACGAVLEFRRI
jgi:hypothetical protein